MKNKALTHHHTQDGGLWVICTHQQHNYYTAERREYAHTDGPSTVHPRHSLSVSISSLLLSTFHDKLTAHVMLSDLRPLTHPTSFDTVTNTGGFVPVGTVSQ
eukprot:GHVQ01017078.1.p2 GENE.GHVQ01017078.1~~GHVQ01017078.1.p2  ORF type:complete len:102 (+),score=11.55 GHVQ01017078.1:96-401(+)